MNVTAQLKRTQAKTCLLTHSLRLSEALFGRLDLSASSDDM